MIIEMNKDIWKSHGKAGRQRLSKTFLYDDYGKLIKRINNKRNKKKNSG
jgi:hypothetical protein